MILIFLCTYIHHNIKITFLHGNDNSLTVYDGLLYVAFGNKEAIFLYWKRIERLRLDNDLTQQDVADLLFCQREVYRRYEKGIRELPLSYAIVLADYYHVSIDYIVERTSCKLPYPK